MPGRKNQAPGAGILSDQQLQRKIAIVAVSARQSLRHRGTRYTITCIYMLNYYIDHCIICRTLFFLYV